MEPLKPISQTSNVVINLLKLKKEQVENKLEDILSRNGYGGRILRHRPYDSLPFIIIEIKKAENQDQVKKNIVDILKANGVKDGKNDYCDAILDGVKIFIAPDNLKYI